MVDIDVEAHLHLAGDDTFGIVGRHLGGAAIAGHAAENLVERHGRKGEANHSRHQDGQN
ncbi:hypothetical protein D3C87_1898020 [compost metagenome]